MISRDKVLTVRGIVTPHEWDESDDVVAVAICTVDDSTYVVKARPAVRKLLRHIDELIEATGHVEGEEDSDETVFVLEDFETVDDRIEEDEDAEDWNDVGDAAQDWDDELRSRRLTNRRAAWDAVAWDDDEDEAEEEDEDLGF